MVLNEQTLETPKKISKSFVTKYDPKQIYALVTLIVVINVLILIYMRRKMKREQNNQLNLQVQSAVSQYFALSGTETAWKLVATLNT